MLAIKIKKNWVFLFSISLNVTVAIYIIFSSAPRGLTSELWQKFTANLFPNSSAIKFSNYYLDRTSLFGILPKNQSNIIFLGDSLIERCVWSELLNKPTIKNRGISGDSLYGLINRLSQVTELKPQKIFLMIGINDLITHKNLDDILYQYRVVLFTIKQSSPDTQVFVQSVLPINPRFKATVNYNDIININRELKIMAELFNYEYIDLYSFLASDNQLAEQYTNDGLHLNGEGYAVWKQIIQKYVD